ncbi:hypothetical protein D3C76_1317690 [compost metagenome]
MVRQMGLDDHPARLFGAAGTTGDLDDELGHAFAGAEVGGEQAAIGVEDGHQGHPGEMVPLGEHLGADQDAGFAALDGGEQLVHGVLARGAVAVDAQNLRFRKQDRQAFLGAFGAGAHRAQVYPPAIGTAGRLALGMAAMMAAQLVEALVQGHACIAARALADPAAVMAQQGRRETAAVEEHQHLLAGGQGLGDGLL